MNNIVVFSLFLFFTASCYCAAPATYVEFQQLPQAQQRALVADDTSPVHMKLVNWWWHLKVGDKAWQRKEQRRLIEGHGYGSLWLFFDQYAELKRQFMQLALERQQIAGMSATALDQIAPQVFKAQQAAADELDDVTELLSSLKDTEAARQVNKRAGELVNEWIQRSLRPGGPMFSQEEMAAMDNTRREMLGEVSRLPRCTQQETQAQIDALPPDFPNVRGLDIP